MEYQLMDLCGTWSLTVVPNAEAVAANFCPRTVDEAVGSEYLTISGQVPGAFELDLHAAGLAPDPYSFDHPLRYQQYENRHLYYGTRFSVPPNDDGDVFLVFEGIDTVADIYLNGELLGHTENMLIPHEFCVTEHLRPENELLVHIYPATIYARRYPLTPNASVNFYNAASLPLRKAPYMYGWDIMPRFVSGGLYRPVCLVSRPRERLEQVYLYTAELNDEKNLSRLIAFYELRTDADDLRELRVTVDGEHGASTFHMERQVWHTYDHVQACFEGLHLWYPRGAGAQALYEVSVRLWRGEEMLDERRFRFGVRTVRLLRTSTTDAEENGEFVFLINGKKTFCLGTNWVPTDAFPARHKEHREMALQALLDIGCNTVRCWGGNVYEQDEFYDFCDTHGILVWQDFSMACAVYPRDRRFAELLYHEAVAVIRRLRSHPSLILWAGDNECDEIAMGWAHLRRDPNRNLLTREVLRRAVEEEDVVRPYLPSSPYLDEAVYRTGGIPSERHLWGPRDYFKGNYYKNAACHFASEIGYHGCPAPSSLARFIRKKQLWPIVRIGADGAEHIGLDWRVHATCMEAAEDAPHASRIPLMMAQVREMFGALPEDLESFCRASQISQAEAKKYFIERFRIAKWRRTGIIWWNLIDGWPQVSDAVIDYYGVRKLAYHFIRRSQAPLCLMVDEAEQDRYRLYAVNDHPEAVEVRYRVSEMYFNENGVLTCLPILNGSQAVPADAAALLKEFPFTNERAILLIEWESAKGRAKNHYTIRTKEASLSDYLRLLSAAELADWEGFGDTDTPE